MGRVIIAVRRIEVEHWGKVHLVYPGNEVDYVRGHRDLYGHHRRVPMLGPYFSFIVPFGPQARGEGRRVVPPLETGGSMHLYGNGTLVL